MPQKSVEKVQVSVLLPKEIIRCLDQEVKKAKKPSRAAALAEVARKFFRGKFGGKAAVRAAYDELLDEAQRLKVRGSAHMGVGDIVRGRQCFLAAASKELEALSMLNEPNEESIRTAVIEVVALVKAGTGYKHLPSVPPKHEEVGLATV